MTQIDGSLIGELLVLDGVGYRDRDAITLVPGAKFKDDHWTMPMSWAAIKILRSTFPDRLQIHESVHEWLWAEFSERIGPATKAREHAMDPKNDSPRSLVAPGLQMYPFQNTGVDFMVKAGSAILADEMGTGKTVQAIATAEFNDLDDASGYPMLVIVPKSGKAGWAREFKRWAPWRSVVSVGGSAARRRQALETEADVYVVGWEALRIHSRLAPYGSVRLTTEEKTPKELNRPWGTVVADEAHRALTPKAKQTRALWQVGATASHRYALTGTPVANHPDDFWSLLHFVAPSEWPSRTKFIDRYCLTTWNGFGGVDVIGLAVSTADEFHSLVAPRFLRRPKELVLPWLPPKIRVRRDVEMSPKQKRAYDQFVKDMVADVDGGLAMALDPLSLATRLSQLASACMEVLPDGQLRMCEPSTKIDELLEFLEEVGEEPVVVFAQSRQLIELAATRLEKHGITFSKIVGGQSDLVNSLAESDFQEGKVRCILLTSAAGSEALTLTRSGYTVHLNRSWSLVQNKQADDRTDRPGQVNEKVMIVDFVAPGTVEEDLLDGIEGKAEMFEEIARDRQALVRMVKAHGK